MDFIGSRWSLAAQHERGTRCFLRGDLDVDVRGTSLRQALAHDAMREFGTVAVAAEVAEVKMLKLGGDDLDCDFRSSFVGKMAVPAGDALFEAPGPARIILEHFQIVIRFEHKHVGGADPFTNEARGVAEIGEKTNLVPARVEHEANGIVGVVRDGKRIHAHIADIEGSAGGKDAAIEFGFELKLDGFAREAVAVNRDP